MGRHGTTRLGMPASRPNCHFEYVKLYSGHVFFIILVLSLIPVSLQEGQTTGIPNQFRTLDIDSSQSNDAVKSDDTNHVRTLKSCDLNEPMKTNGVTLSGLICDNHLPPEKISNQFLNHPASDDLFNSFKIIAQHLDNDRLGFSAFIHSCDTCPVTESLKAFQIEVYKSHRRFQYEGLVDPHSILSFVNKINNSHVEFIDRKDKKKAFDKEEDNTKVVVYEQDNNQGIEVSTAIWTSLAPEVSVYRVNDKWVAHHMSLKRGEGVYLYTPYSEQPEFLSVEAALQGIWQRSGLIQKITPHNVYALLTRRRSKAVVLLKPATLDGRVVHKTLKKTAKFLKHQESLVFFWLDMEMFPREHKHWITTFDLDLSKPNMVLIDLNDFSSTWLEPDLVTESICKEGRIRVIYDWLTATLDLDLTQSEEISWTQPEDDKMTFGETEACSMVGTGVSGYKTLDDNAPKLSDVGKCRNTHALTSPDDDSACQYQLHDPLIATRKQLIIEAEPLFFGLIPGASAMFVTSDDDDDEDLSVLDDDEPEEEEEAEVGDNAEDDSHKDFVSEETKSFFRSNEYKAWKRGKSSLRSKPKDEPEVEEHLEEEEEEEDDDDSDDGFFGHHVRKQTKEFFESPTWRKFKDGKKSGVRKVPKTVEEHEAEIEHENKDRKWELGLQGNNWFFLNDPWMKKQRKNWFYDNDPWLKMKREEQRLAKLRAEADEHHLEQTEEDHEDHSDAQVEQIKPKKQKKSLEEKPKKKKKKKKKRSKKEAQKYFFKNDPWLRMKRREARHEDVAHSPAKKKASKTKAKPQTKPKTQPKVAVKTQIPKKSQQVPVKKAAPPKSKPIPRKQIPAPVVKPVVVNVVDKVEEEDDDQQGVKNDFFADDPWLARKSKEDHKESKDTKNPAKKLEKLKKKAEKKLKHHKPHFGNVEFFKKDPWLKYKRREGKVEQKHQPMQEEKPTKQQSMKHHKVGKSGKEQQVEKAVKNPEFFENDPWINRKKSGHQEDAGKPDKKKKISKRKVLPEPPVVKNPEFFAQDPWLKSRKSDTHARSHFGEHDEIEVKSAQTKQQLKQRIPPTPAKQPNIAAKVKQAKKTAQKVEEVVKESFFAEDQWLKKRKLDSGARSQQAAKMQSPDVAEKMKQAAKKAIKVQKKIKRTSRM